MDDKVISIKGQSLRFYYEHNPAQKWAHTFKDNTIRDWRDQARTHAALLQWCRDQFGPIKQRFCFDPHRIAIGFAEDRDALLFRLNWVAELTDQKPKE